MPFISVHKALAKFVLQASSSVQVAAPMYSTGYLSALKRLVSRDCILLGRMSRSGMVLAEGTETMRPPALNTDWQCVRLNRSVKEHTPRQVV